MTVRVRLTGSLWGKDDATAPRGSIVDAEDHDFSQWNGPSYFNGRYVGSISKCEDQGFSGQLVAEDEAEDEAEADEDVVNHPSHYTSDPSGVECIQITRHRNFNIGNAIKYLWRNGLKSDPAQEDLAKQIEDLKKALFYIDDEISRLEGEAE